MFFDRPESGERAILVHLDFPQEHEREDPREFEELALSAGADPLALLTGSRKLPHRRTFIGSGKLEELAALVAAEEAEVVLFNHSLSPSQERNLEQELQCRVLDRTGLILDIFAQRARTHEGQLQVELAQLQHVSTRLVRGWTHLERQKGGIGLRGPGETQLETDRRLLRARIKSILKRLEKVQKQRDQGRRARSRAEIPTVSLVGYTNAGKSTLFNHITDADVYVEDKLFATLDPTLRRLTVSGYGPVIFADTVGFIRHLPHKLVDAFKATLEETIAADLLLHVIDVSSDERHGNIEQVNNVLEEIEADNIPCLHVYNKIDLAHNAEPRIDRDENGVPYRVWMSAKTGAGSDLLLEAVAECLSSDTVQKELLLKPEQAKLRAKFYDIGAVQSEAVNEEGCFLLSIRIPKPDLMRLLQKEQLELADLLAPDSPCRVAS